MRKCKNPNVIIQTRVYNNERESRRKVSPGSVITKRPTFGRLSYCLNCPLNLGREIKTKSRRFVFVIGYSLQKFRFSLT